MSGIGKVAIRHDRPPAATACHRSAARSPRAHARRAHRRWPRSLLNVAHAIDHLVLLIFATAVGAIAVDFGFARWEDLMPFAAGAFVLFGLGSVPAGRLGDHWGRRAMMLVFFFGIGAVVPARRRDAERVAARGRADAHGRVRVDLPSGRHPDARAAHDAARAR